MKTHCPKTRPKLEPMPLAKVFTSTLAEVLKLEPMSLAELLCPVIQLAKFLQFVHNYSIEA